MYSLERSGAGVFRTLGALIEAIESFLTAWNDAQETLRLGEVSRADPGPAAPRQPS
jgi:hypothetical protein